MKQSGIFNSTGAALNIGFGLVPAGVKITNLTSGHFIKWDRAQLRGDAAQQGGVASYIDTAAWKAALLTVATGIIPFLGGNVLDPAVDTLSANLIDADTYMQAGTQIVYPYAGDMRSKSSSQLTAFILDNATNKTGHFNVAVDTTYVGVGSRVWIGGEPFNIIGLASTGAAANQVTLDRVPNSGNGSPAAGVVGSPSFICDKITYKYDYVGGHAGKAMPRGITISDTTYVNTGTGLVLVEFFAGDALLG